MKLPKIFFRKLIIGAVLLAIATGMTAFIKESLDTQDPESALPIITVLYGDEELVPDKEVRRAGWEWNFFLTQEKNAAALAGGRAAAACGRDAGRTDAHSVHQGTFGAAGDACRQR